MTVAADSVGAPGPEPDKASVTDLRQLAAAAAHEIRNPLNTMAIHCELLESRLQRTGPEVKDRDALIRSVAALTGEVQRIDVILDRFLTHAGPEEAEREPVEAEEWLKGALGRTRTAATRKGVRLLLRHGPLGRWHVDAVTLARALDAVVDNAVLATAPGGEVQVHVTADEERAIIEVRDNGPGIAKDLLAGVCQVGYSTRPGHAGLGLAIAKQVVKAQHGGDLRIDSRVGEGTCVTLSVPLDDEI